MASRNLRTNRPNINQATKSQSGAGKSGAPPKITIPWGRSASEYRPGKFAKRYFIEHGEACASEIYYALSQEIKVLNEERIGIEEKPFRRPNYSSFSRYLHWFLILGLIERTDRREPAVYDFLQQKVFYTLTETGRAEVRAWEDPIAATHPEFR
jgi:hypothetical protein